MHSTTDSTRDYLDHIGQVPLLDASEERALAERIRRGQQAQGRIDAGETSAALLTAVREAGRAKEQFVHANLRLVVSVAKRYPIPPGMELLDLIQEGNVGLEHAVDKYDHTKGFKFSTYGTFWIRQAIGRAIDQQGSPIRLPAYQRVQLRAALRSSSATGEDLDEGMEAFRRLMSPASLDQPIGRDGGGCLGDLLADDVAGPEPIVVDQLQDDLVVGLLEVLDPRPRRAVELRMGLADGRSRSYREVGQDLGVTAEAARRMVQRALGVLRDAAAAFGVAA